MTDRIGCGDFLEFLPLLPERFVDLLVLDPPYNLTKRFGPLAAVSDVSLAIEEGEMFTLLGPSGCGKTTLLRLIAGFYAPDEGTIRFGERVVNAVPPHERGIGMVFQNYALWPHMTVAENVSYGLKLRKVGGSEIADRVKAVLEKVKLGGLGDRGERADGGCAVGAAASSAWMSIAWPSPAV